MSFVEHLAELRVRLRNSALVFIAAIGVSFYFVKNYFDFLTRPARAAWVVALAGQEPVFRFASPTEPFWVYTKLAMYGALLVASPFIFWELWRFVAPGLYRKEKKMALVVTAATAVCFIGGALFGYGVLCKPALTYMLSFAEVFPTGTLHFKIEPAVMMDEVVGFMMAMMMGTGVAFELPVILAVMGWLGLVTAKGLWRFNKYALVLAFIVGGVLTPGPDVLSQVLMSTPLFGLFNISILIVWMIERAARKRLAALAKETGADLVPSADD
ncbi:MAG TPA: twin-arginine translocase subunit TatC [Polyangia bacterium]|jgi:sec-independent protein translocase protein TatC|nr:twin-arginine translocase subunit TatC [Polyangia bacterium]